MRFRGTLYRALNPVYARDPLSGQGAALYGGRFNKKGRKALYTALSPDTAIRESNQVGTLQPTTLVAYAADVTPVFDGYDEPALAQFKFSVEQLATDDWRDRMKYDGIAPTQCFAERLIEDGFIGLLIPSYARGATQSDQNLVLWRWRTSPSIHVSVIDDEDRLTHAYD